ncbi:MAG: hypothetical protein GX235_12845 [Clostridiales bacterium]|nr:hypothetical protein [Clostridiales bacterium]
MPYVDKYKQYLDENPLLVAYSKEELKAPVFAYTSNLDVVLGWDSKIYNEILDAYLKEEPYVKEGDVMNTLEDFARISSYYLMRGLGGNFDITNIEVCNYLKEKFVSEFALGGTCAQAAAAIGTMGFPVNVHLTDRCKQVSEMMDHEGTTVIKDNKKVPIMQGISDEEPVYHFILQFNKGDKIRILGREVEIPLSNRLILFYDTVHKEVPIMQEFLEYWDRSSQSPSSYLISGFDAIIDPEVMKKRLLELEPYLECMRTKHPETVIYFEGAFYMNPKVKEQASDMFGRYAHIFGMNEEELEQQAKRFGYEIDVEKIEDVLKGLEVILSKYPVKGIILHTKDYAMYYGVELEGVDIERGLTMGNIMSATRARIGRYGNPEECRETLALALSERGLQFAQAAEDRETDRMIKVVPSRYLEHPKYTIGLGDTFTAGVHICFIKKK